MNEQTVSIVYTNWKGETAVRRITPHAIRYAATVWHPEPQWLLDAWDWDKNAPRSFAMKDIQNWAPAP